MKNASSNGDGGFALNVTINNGRKARGKRRSAGFAPAPAKPLGEKDCQLDLAPAEYRPADPQEGYLPEPPRLIDLRKEIMRSEDQVALDVPSAAEVEKTSNGGSTDEAGPEDPRGSFTLIRLRVTDPNGDTLFRRAGIIPGENVDALELDAYAELLRPEKFEQGYGKREYLWRIGMVKQLAASLGHDIIWKAQVMDVPTFDFIGLVFMES